jgi:uncharacterized protein (DUF2249 family)
MTTTLDVRPILAAGGSPLQVILDAADALGPDESLRLIAPFEPMPLYEVLAKRGLAARCAPQGDAFAVTVERIPLQDAVALDVRLLEPPGPMMAVLDKLTELGPGAHLEVRHHREPVLLYEKLAGRGYAARAIQVGESDWRIRILPAWAQR